MIWTKITDLATYLYDRQNIIFIESLFAVLYLVMKKFAVYLWDHDKGRFIYIRMWYYWYEYIYVFIAAVLAPKHSVNESIVTITTVIIIKLIFDKTKMMENYLDKRLGNKMK